MTTNGSQSCPNCVTTEAARAAAVAEAAARQAAIERLCDILAPGQDGSYRRLAAFMRKEAHEIVLAVRDPSPAVAALERRLEQATKDELLLDKLCELTGEEGPHAALLKLELLRGWKDRAWDKLFETIEQGNHIAELERRLAPMPCGHPGACVVSWDGDADFCGWCETIAKGAAAYNALFEDWERAEALAALVPEADMLQAAACWIEGSPSADAVGIIYAGNLLYELRALAASIEEAQGQGQTQEEVLAQLAAECDEFEYRMEDGGSD